MSFPRQAPPSSTTILRTCSWRRAPDMVLQRLEGCSDREAVERFSRREPDLPDPWLFATDSPCPDFAVVIPDRLEPTVGYGRGERA